MEAEAVRPNLTGDEIRQLLLTAEVVGAKQNSSGIVGPYQLTLSDGKITHDALFNELIYNADWNLQNILIGKSWEIYMVDFSRAFRPYHDLKNPKDLVRCSRELLKQLAMLKAEELEEKAGKYLNESEIESVMRRRDKIMQHFYKLMVERGETEVFF